MENNNNWISVEDRLPDFDEYVLWHCPSGIMQVWEIDKDMDWQWVEERWGEDTPTHWMPLPEGPEMKKT